MVEEKREWKIHKRQNKINGKIYIGQTKQYNWKTRLQQENIATRYCDNPQVISIAIDIITAETDRPYPFYCWSCYKLEECDILCGRGGQMEDFYHVLGVVDCYEFETEEDFNKYKMSENSQFNF